MNVYAISDLHLSIHCPKPMDIFGGQWENYIEAIESDWRERVTSEDVVLICGDISWAMTLEGAVPDLDWIASLPGKKVLIRGNHDYWWASIGKVRACLAPGVYALQNDALRFENVVIAGSRGWTVPEGSAPDAHDVKIYAREAQRLELSLAALQALRKEGDTALVLMHYPPFNVRREGSLFTALFQRYDIRKVIYGHLHGRGGRMDLMIKKDGIDYFLTSCDQVANKLVRIL